MTETTEIAVIGGTGLYDLPGLKEIVTIHPDTPYGKASAPITIGSLGGTKVAFLARHGIGHVFNPSEVNYRANIYSLKTLGVRKVISVSACGSLREDFAPGHIVIPDQLFDFTRNQKRTFYEDGCVAHAGSANPFCEELRSIAIDSLHPTKAVVHTGGTLITIEGPRFSTRAESNLFRSWGMSIIGMTACPEAFLAREAEMAFVAIAHVTDYDVWHTNEEEVSVEMVVRTLNNNTQLARESIHNMIMDPRIRTECSCESSMKDALITNPSSIGAEALLRLRPINSKYLP
jgi:5'-methylthioadenosine phosphorylase